MQSGDVLMSYSPVSNATSATTSSPSRSPVRRQYQNGLPAHSQDSNNTPMLDSRYAHEVQSSRACEKCRASKRKCDKKLPSCDRCLRYDFILHTSIFGAAPLPWRLAFASRERNNACDAALGSTLHAGLRGYFRDLPCFSCLVLIFALRVFVFVSLSVSVLPRLNRVLTHYVLLG
jgi:hypothetical protein